MLNMTKDELKTEFLKAALLSKPELPLAINEDNWEEIFVMIMDQTPEEYLGIVNQMSVFTILKNYLKDVFEMYIQKIKNLF
jgi:hypothetical protein